MEKSPMVEHERAEPEGRQAGRENKYLSILIKSTSVLHKSKIVPWSVLFSSL